MRWLGSGLPNELYDRVAMHFERIVQRRHVRVQDRLYGGCLQRVFARLWLQRGRLHPMRCWYVFRRWNRGMCSVRGELLRRCRRSDKLHGMLLHRRGVSDLRELWRLDGRLLVHAQGVGYGLHG